MIGMVSGLTEVAVLNLSPVVQVIVSITMVGTVTMTTIEKEAVTSMNSKANITIIYLAGVVGRFNGKNTRDQSPVSITISQKGEVAATWSGVRHSGYFDGRNLRIDDMDFVVKQVRGGFETILRKDHGNRVVFQRAR